MEAYIEELSESTLFCKQFLEDEQTTKVFQVSFYLTWKIADL